jgi:hypothetical protein
MRDFTGSSFRLALERFGENAAGKTQLIVRKVALDLFRGVVMDTPVDTGRARANWQVSLGRPAIGQVKHDSGSPELAAEAAIGAGTPTIQAAPGDVAIYLTNNVPYIVPLEEGHSGQAPQGMVRKNIARFPYLVEEAAKE